jgi:hypothetical protein
MLLDMDKVFDSHELFNKWQVLEGNKVNSGGIAPSIYITEIKLRKAFRDFSPEEIWDLYKADKINFNLVGADEKRKKLFAKITDLHDWQLFRALEILIDIGRLECAQFVILSLKSDMQPDEKNNLL